MKRLVALLLISSLIIGALAACGRDNEPKPESTPEPTPEPVYVYQDGTYSVSYAVPAYDRTLDYLTVSITGDKITVKDYGLREDAPAESDASGAPSAPEASSSAQSSEGGLSEDEEKAKQAAKQILAAFNAAGQDAEKMEVVEGAEEHSYRFLRMMRTIDRFAKEGDASPVTLGKYADGRYESSMPTFNPGGWKEFVRLTVKDGLVSEVEFDAKKNDEAGTLITADPDLNKQGAADSPSVYYPQIAKSFLEAGGDLNAVEAPSGGAQAMKSFKKLMKPLLVSMISAGDEKVTASMYVDGTYKVSFKDFDENGWKDYIVVDIKDGLVNIREFDAVSKADETRLKSQDGEMSARMKEKTGISPADYVPGLIREWEGADSDILGVDNIAGATVSTNNFKVLLGQLLATAAVEGDSEGALEVARVAVE